MTNIQEAKFLSTYYTMNELLDNAYIFLKQGDPYNWYCFHSAWWFSLTFKYSTPYLFAWTQCINCIRQANKVR